MEKEAKMNCQDMQILIVADDQELVAGLTCRIVTELDAHITTVDSVEEAQIAAASDAFDVIIASDRLPEGSGLSILRGEDEMFDAHLLLLVEETDADHLLNAFRNGALDVFPAPFDLDRLIEVTRGAVERRRIHRHLAHRTKRLRRISSRLVRDRRELRSRVDLICRDLVQAYQRLATKFVGMDREGMVAGADSRFDSMDRIDPME